MGRGPVATLAAIAALAAAQPAAAEPIEIGHIPECLELVPAAISLDTSPTRLDVLVLLDGVSVDRGQEVMETAGTSYSPLGIDLVASYQSVNSDGNDAMELLAQAKVFVGGVTPPGIDVVYVLTSKDLELMGTTAVAGLADCIGGVAFPNRAFAIGENFTVDEGGLLGLPGAANRNLTAKVVSHEIGHLMGGHHHYANCIEGILTETDEVSPCTVMFNDIGLASLNFGALNSLVVQGHGQQYAR